MKKLYSLVVVLATGLAMAQAGAPVICVDRVRRPNAFVVSTAVLDGFEHPCNPLSGVEADDSGDATHDC